MAIKPIPSDAFKQLVAELRKIDKAADKVQVEGVAQLAQTKSAAVLSSAKPELADLSAAEELSGKLTKAITSEADQAFGAVGPLNKDRVDRLLED